MAAYRPKQVTLERISLLQHLVSKPIHSAHVLMVKNLKHKVLNMFGFLGEISFSKLVSNKAGTGNVYQQQIQCRKIVLKALRPHVQAGGLA